MTDMPNCRTEALTHRELAQAACGQLCHFGTYGLNSGQHHAMAYDVLWDASTCAP